MQEIVAWSSRTPSLRLGEGNLHERVGTLPDTYEQGNEIGERRD